MDRDGTKDGYDTELVRAISEAVDVPVIASGGAGEPQHLVDALRRRAPTRSCSPRSCTTGKYSVAELKRHLAAAGVSVREPSA